MSKTMPQTLDQYWSTLVSQKFLKFKNRSLACCVHNGRWPQNMSLMFCRYKPRFFSVQVRSRVFNLKDKKNPALRESVLCGLIEPEKFAVMSSEEMASDEVSPA